MFDYPRDLVATEPKRPSRVLLVEGDAPCEIRFDQIDELFTSKDVLVLNDSKVIPRRIFSQTGDEIVFIEAIDETCWTVLYPVKGRPLGYKYQLPGGITMTLKEKGRPQTVEVSEELTLEWFLRYGELALPPYIQKARGASKNLQADRSDYQTAWAEVIGSLAAPTASLHFRSEDLDRLTKKGVTVVKVTLHVGLGTFLPVSTEDLNQHQMHSEFYQVSDEGWQALCAAKSQGQRITALGTTSCRVLETLAAGGGLTGQSDLFIKPPYEFKMVDRLMTNFHQPGSTLLALLMAFSGRQTVMKSYQWAIDRQFRLFSYGDLSIWQPSDGSKSSMEKL